MKRRTIILATVGLMLLGAACREPRDKAFLIRLIDRLARQDIRRSPFLESASGSLQELFTPMYSRPLTDSGSGENPFQLKKKLHYGGADMNVLFAPPQSEFAFDLDRGAGWKLEFGLGIKQDANSDRIRGESTGFLEQVVFEVFVESRGREQNLFSKSVSIPAAGRESTMTYSEHSLSLPELDQPARLVLKTRGAPRAFALWFNPVLLRQEDLPPCVVLVSLDTLRADRLGCYGYDRPTSPNLDALAAESVLYERAYAPSPWTLPSHVSLLTGLQTSSHKVGFPEDRMDPAIVTLADVLRRRGFLCSALTGGGFLSPLYGFSKGFDFYSEVEGSFDFPDSAERLAMSAARLLERNRDRRFFLFLHTYQIHDPYACPPPYNRMFVAEDDAWGELDIKTLLGGESGVFRPLSGEQRRNIIGLYDGEVRYTDEALIKPLVDTLRRLGLFERTLLIVTSDHGEEFFEHGAWIHTNNLYDESIRVPLLVKFPGSRFKGKRVVGNVGVIDILPTVLDVLGIAASPGELDGRSLLEAAKRGRAADRSVLAEMEWEAHAPAKKCLIQGWDKLIQNEKPRGKIPPAQDVPSPARSPLELYKLDRDPGEKNDLSGREPGLVRRLSEALRALLDSAPRRLRHTLRLDPALKERLRALGYIR